MAYTFCCVAKRIVKIMVTKILKSGYCNLMMAYYVDYIDDSDGKTRTYFDYVYERNKFIADNQ